MRTVFGELHELALAPSNEHKNELPPTEDENEKVAVLELIVPLGPTNASVCGGAPPPPNPADETSRAEAKLDRANSRTTAATNATNGLTTNIQPQ